MSNVARDEVKLLDLDLREIYKDYGSQELYVIKYDKEKSVVDDVYREETEAVYSEPYKVMGMVTYATNPKENKGLGEKETNSDYTIRVLKTSLDEHLIDSITTDDKIKYLDTILDIQSVKRDSVVGDYFLQYKIGATSSSVTGFKSFGE